jgi:osmoprotectant transport system permease protein
MTAVSVTLFAQGGPVIPNFGQGDKCIRTNGNFCLHWFLDNFSAQFWPRVVEHIELTAIALGIGFLVSFAAALAAYRYSRLEVPFANVSALFYTIPSIALFQILVPITGIGWTTVELALVSYTLLILFRNTLTGLKEVPDEAKEAAEGMGLTRRQSLLRVELPLAVPAIVAGVRVAAVTTISLATVAALITPLGLGAPIFDALHTSANTEFIGASLLAIALALIADVAIVIVQRMLTPWVRARSIAR